MKRKRIYQFIGIVGFIIILSRIEVGRIWQELCRAQPYKLIAVGGISFAVQMVKSLRWRALLKLNNIRCPVLAALRIYLIGTFLGAFTPARIGDLSRVYFIKHGYAADRPVGQIFANVFVDRVFDLVFVAVVAMIGIPFLFKIWFNEVVVVSLVTGGILILIYFYRHKIIKRIKRILKPAETLSPAVGWTAHLDETVNGLRMLRTRKVIGPAIYNVVSYCLFFFSLSLMAASLRMAVPFWYLSVSMSAAMIMTFLPISIAGLGTRDAVLIFFFSFLGIKNETTIGFSLLYLFFFLIWPSLLGAVPYFLLSSKQKEMIALRESFKE